jgi:hypothetical protein
MELRNSILKLGAIVVLSFFAFTGYSQECGDVRTGKFYYLYGPDSVRFDASRRKNSQIENSDELGMKYKMKVEWLSDCRYRLSSWKIIEDETGELRDFGFAICDITEVTSEGYKVKYRFKGSPEVFENFLFRIE